MAPKPVPDGFHTVTPYLVVEDVPRLIEFLEKAFDAKEIHRTTLPDGSVMHAQVVIGDSPVMMGQSRDERKPIPSCLYVYVSDADASYRQTLEAGATSLVEPQDQFYGDRSGGVEDPLGNSWWVATHVEDVSPEEIERRAAAMGQEKAKG